MGPDEGSLGSPAARAPRRRRESAVERGEPEGDAGCNQVTSATEIVMSRNHATIFVGATGCQAASCAG
ncbi:hypothetical protein BACI9J_700002 [Bacillus altitudinis]|nr:hypothetical protein BACI9J_700002 [Bacillus altitudinis]